jgi:hypothetical protein
MAGNTRGKLKEHFEGIHRNFDWSLHHINTALSLIVKQLQAGNAASEQPVDEATLSKIIETHPLYVGIKSLGEGIAILDDLAQGIYGRL